MRNKTKLVKKLKNDINSLNKRIENRRLYNIRNFIISNIIHYCSVLEFMIPFLLSGTLSINVVNKDDNHPFRVDLITDKASVSTIDTSSGLHQEKKSFDIEYDEELLEYSTGWVLNENNLFERTVTKYQLSDDIDLNDTEKIISMSKEDLESILVTTDIKTIVKNKLGPEDYIYNEDAIIITNHYISEDETRVRNETVGENLWSSFIYLLLTITSGVAVLIIKNKVLKLSLKEKLCYWEENFKIIKKDDLIQLNEILKLKQKNLNLLEETQESSEYTYQLRKK